MKKQLKMRVKVTKRQFNILVNNFQLLKKGLQLKMSGKTAKEIIKK
jgi:hypothetical protein